MQVEADVIQHVERDALYYPYIHIPGVDWLKRALLVFPHVARIVPDSYVLNESKEIWEFENVLGRWDKPLLRKAKLRSPGVQQAQNLLLQLLSKLDFGRFRRRGREHFPYGARYDAEFRYCLGAAVT